MENVITFMQYWYLIKRTTNSAGIRANWINCVLYKVLLNLHIFPVLNIYCTEPYLGPVQRSYVYLYWQSHGPLIPIKSSFNFLSVKSLKEYCSVGFTIYKGKPEVKALNGAISICRLGCAAWRWLGNLARKNKYHLAIMWNFPISLLVNTYIQETIKGTEKASSVHTLFHG